MESNLKGILLVVLPLLLRTTSIDSAHFSSSALLSRVFAWPTSLHCFVNRDRRCLVLSVRNRGWEVISQNKSEINKGQERCEERNVKTIVYKTKIIYKTKIMEKTDYDMNWINMWVLTHRHHNLTSEGKCLHCMRKSIILPIDIQTHPTCFPALWGLVLWYWDWKCGGSTEKEKEKGGSDCSKKSKSGQISFFSSRFFEIQVAITQHFSFVNVMEKVGHDHRKSVKVHRIEKKAP